jgi:hypothetical protein
MILGITITQSAATIIVAVVGILGTLLAPVFTQRQQRTAERERWIRDRRVDVYLRVTGSYLDALLSLTESRTMLSEIASIHNESDAIAARVQQLKAESPPTMTEVDLAGIRAELERCAHETETINTRVVQLNNELDINTAQVEANYDQFKSQLMPLRVLGSRSVETLADQVLEQIATLQGDVGERRQSNLRPLYLKWAQLDNTMREDLGISD